MWGVMERQNWGARDLEQAAREGRRVMDQDLSGVNLRDADLDGLQIEHCNIRGADLRGCNLSDAMIRHCDLTDVDAMDLCLANSMLEQCDFSHACLNGSILTGARFSSCRFAGPAALMLDWSCVDLMDHVSYIDVMGRVVAMNEPPLVVQGPGGILAWIGPCFLRNNTMMACDSGVMGLGDGLKRLCLTLTEDP